MAGTCKHGELTFSFHTVKENFVLDEKLLTSQRGLCSMVLEVGVFLFPSKILPSFTTLLIPHMTLKLLSTYPAHITIQKHHYL